VFVYQPSNDDDDDGGDGSGRGCRRRMVVVVVVVVVEVVVVVVVSVSVSVINLFSAQASSLKTQSEARIDWAFTRYDRRTDRSVRLVCSTGRSDDRTV